MCWSRDDATDGEHGGWRLRTMFDDVPLPLDWPVYVSHAEANAYARWAGKTLPTEAQWQRAADGAPHGASGNFDFRSWDSQPVDAHPDNVSAFGVEGQFGNGWEWTSTLFAPLPDFEAFPLYLGYSANFFDDQHYVQRRLRAHRAVHVEASVPQLVSAAIPACVCRAPVCAGVRNQAIVDSDTLPAVLRRVTNTSEHKRVRRAFAS